MEEKLFRKIKKLEKENINLKKRIVELEKTPMDKKVSMVYNDRELGESSDGMYRGG
jgi:hypothetical protein